MGAAYSAEELPNDVRIACFTHIGSRIPLYNGFYSRNLDKNHFWYPHSDGITLGTKINIDRGKQKMDKIVNKLSSIHERLSS